MNCCEGISLWMMTARHVLAKWLQEWEIHRIVSRSAEDLQARATAARGAGSFTMSPLGGVGKCGRSARIPKIGQVRLLRPSDGRGETSSSMDRPVYVLVLKETRDGFWLVAPFGRFSTPAVPGEWLTGIRALPLRVLCLWNARVVFGRWVESAWYSGRMTSAKVMDAQEVLRCSLEGAPLERVLATKVGPCLIHPLDPRHEYLQEERTLLDRLVGLGSEGEKSIQRLAYEVPAPEYRKAAEERGKYGEEANDGPDRK